MDLDAHATEERGNFGKRHDYHSKKGREWFGSLEPKDITPPHIAGFVRMIESHGYKKTTANKRLKLLNSVINRAHENAQGA